MLKRPEDLSLFTRENVHDEVKLTAGETPEARFKTWFAHVTATPRFCRKHLHTKLALDSDATGFRPAYSSYGSSHDPKPGEFVFAAVFRCPACRVASACCPPEFHTTSFETFDTATPERAAMLARAREFVAQVNKQGCGFALFVGGPGTGKTRLACNVVRALDKRDALYVRQGELTIALRATYGKRTVEYDDEGRPIEPESPLEITQDVRLLALDEIGCNPLANDERLLLDELLKHRYEQRKPTILISNLALDQLKEFLGDALTDRIKDASGNGRFILQFSGESFRRNAGENYLTGIT